MARLSPRTIVRQLDVLGKYSLLQAEQHPASCRLGQCVA